MKRFTVFISLFLWVACLQKSPEPERDICDMDGDGVVSYSIDGSIFLSAFDSVEGDDEYLANADLNEDGEVSTIDFGIWMDNCPASYEGE